MKWLKKSSRKEKMASDFKEYLREIKFEKYLLRLKKKIEENYPEI